MGEPLMAVVRELIPIWAMTAVAAGLIGYQRGTPRLALACGVVFGPLGLLAVWLSKDGERPLWKLSLWMVASAATLLVGMMTLPSPSQPPVEYEKHWRSLAVEDNDRPAILLGLLSVGVTKCEPMRVRAQLPLLAARNTYFVQCLEERRYSPWHTYKIDIGQGVVDGPLPEGFYPDQGESF